MSASRIRRPEPVAGLLLVAVVVVVVGCSSDEVPAWDKEVQLQLFRPAGLDVGTLKVHASQVNGRQGSIEVADTEGFFSDCDNNSVRIIPAVDGSGPGVITVQITSSTSAFQARTELVKTFGVTKVVLAASSSLEPDACAPGVTIEPDGGIRDKPTGAACRFAAECAGGECLEVFETQGGEVGMPGNYCSASCSDSSDPNKADPSPCDEGDLCHETKDGYGKVTGHYCLAGCSDEKDCRQAEGYQCTPAGACFPVTP